MTSTLAGGGQAQVLDEALQPGASVGLRAASHISAAPQRRTAGKSALFPIADAHAVTGPGLRWAG